MDSSQTSPIDLFLQAKEEIAWDEGSFDLWRSRSPAKVLEEKKAKCIDFVDYFKFIYPQTTGILYKIERKDGAPIHVREDEKEQKTWIHLNCAVEFQGKYFLLEWFWCGTYRQAYGPFESIDEAVKFFIPIMKKSLKKQMKTKFTIEQLQYFEHEYGLTLDELQAFLLNSQPSKEEVKRKSILEETFGPWRDFIDVIIHHNGTYVEIDIKNGQFHDKDHERLNLLQRFADEFIKLISRFDQRNYITEDDPIYISMSDEEKERPIMKKSIITDELLHHKFMKPSDKPRYIHGEFRALKSYYGDHMMFGISIHLAFDNVYGQFNELVIKKIIDWLWRNLSIPSLEKQTGLTYEGSHDGEFELE